MTTSKATPRTFPLSGPINLHARLGHGVLVVTASDSLSEAAVTISARDGAREAAERITVEMNGSTLSVLAPRQGGLPDILAGRRRDRDSVDVQISVPSGTALKISTFTADVIVRGHCGGADVATATGTVDMDEVDGNVRLRYGTATSHVRRVNGSVVVRSGSGDAFFGEITGNLESGTGSGDLDVEVVHGSVRARSGSGLARIGSAHGDVDLVAGSGDLSVGLPEGVSARLDFKTGSGRFSSEMPVEDNRREGGRTIVVRARTGSGDVRLVHAA